MAVTKIHPIKSTLKQALDYIENPDKTDGKMLVSSFGCSYETADIEFEMLLAQAMQKGNNLAHHLIQSFAPGEATPEQAHEIGRRLADEVLQGKYPYVLTTHIDKGHVHNHIIFCAVDMVNCRKYVSNKQSYSFIRRTSDRLCREQGLSVVKPGRDKGQSYAEWDAQRRGRSWKAKLKIAIDAAIPQAKDFDDCPLRKWCGTSSAPASSGPAPGPTEPKISTRRSPERRYRLLNVRTKSAGPARAGKRSLSAQQTIPYVEMLKDGICRVREGFYTKTIAYEDINYSVASSEDQSAIFDGWCGFLNYFDSALPFQLSFINHRSRGGSRYKVNIPMAHDDFDSIRGEYVDMLKRQIARSNNGIVRSKYITFGVPAEGLETARPRLERVSSDIIPRLQCSKCRRARYRRTIRF